MLNLQLLLYLWDTVEEQGHDTHQNKILEDVGHGLL